MKIAVVGNREGWSYERVKTVLDQEKVNRGNSIISGGAIGVDSFAQRYAKENGLKITIIYPFNDMPVPQRYLARNRKIGDECDFMIAFDHMKNEHSGTLYSLHYTQKLGKRVLHIVK
jgi:predicted Rossmann fold nucleotide-binding protein DprA/Smf involved in DNA uptake